MLETATLNEVDLAAYCRSKGLYVEQIAQWRAQCEAAFTPKPMSAAERASTKRIQLLERELLRKEKALAEAAGLPSTNIPVATLGIRLSLLHIRMLLCSPVPSVVGLGCNSFCRFPSSVGHPAG